MKTAFFDGEEFFDDRLYLVHVARCTVSEKDGVRATDVHLGRAPSQHLWCVVTRKNTNRWPPTRIDHFPTEDAALEYLMRVEPLTPLVSLDGKSPSRPLPYAEFCKWKEANGLKDFDWKLLFPKLDREDLVETFYQHL